MLPWPLHGPRFGSTENTNVTANANTGTNDSNGNGNGNNGRSDIDEMTLWTPSEGRLLPPLVSGALYAIVCVTCVRSISSTDYDDGSGEELQSGSGPAILLAITSQSDTIAIWRCDPYAARIGWTQQIVHNTYEHTSPRVIGGARHDWSLLSLNEMYRDCRSVSYHRHWGRIYVVAPDRSGCLDLSSNTWLPLPLWPHYDKIGYVWPTVTHIARHILHVIIFAKTSGCPCTMHYMIPLCPPPSSSCAPSSELPWPAVAEGVTWQLIDGCPSNGFEGSTLLEWHNSLWLGPSNPLPKDGSSGGGARVVSSSSLTSISSSNDYNHSSLSSSTSLSTSYYTNNRHSGSNMNDSNNDDSHEYDHGIATTTASEYEWSEQTVAEVVEEIASEETPQLLSLPSSSSSLVLISVSNDITNESAAAYSVISRNNRYDTIHTNDDINNNGFDTTNLQTCMKSRDAAVAVIVDVDVGSNNVNEHVAMSSSLSSNLPAAAASTNMSSPTHIDVTVPLPHSHHHSNDDNDEYDDDDDNTSSVEKGVFVRFDLDHLKWCCHADDHHYIDLPPSAPSHFLARHVIAVDVAL
jgi:hypothetical protein